jgi:hypothetical protein
MTLENFTETRNSSGSVEIESDARGETRKQQKLVKRQVEYYMQGRHNSKTGTIQTCVPKVFLTTPSHSYPAMNVTRKNFAQDGTSKHNLLIAFYPACPFSRSFSSHTEWHSPTIA